MSDPARGSDLPAIIARVLDGIGVGYVVMREVGERLERHYTSPVAAALLGRPPDVAAGLPIGGAIGGAELGRLFALRRQVASGEAPLPRSIDTTFVHPDGTTVPIEISLGQVQEGGVSYLVALLRDRSARKQIEDALRNSEQRFRTLIDEAPDAITVTVDGRLVYANQVCADIFGYDSVEELLAQPMTALMPKAELGKMAERIARMIASGERSKPVEYVGTRKDGTLVTAEVVSLPLEFEGQPAVLGYARDIGERKRMQVELMQADRMASVGALAAGVAHEINNPLTYVLLHLNHLRQRLPALIADPAQAEDVARVLDEATEGGERVRVIVRDLLTFSRSEVVERELVDPVQVVQSTIKLAATSIRQRANLETRLERVPLIESSRARLGQVVLNLVVNASQAFPRDDPGANRIEVELAPSGDGRFTLAVRDNGPGVSPADLARLFDAFYTTKPGGNGLGLTITRSIVEQLGGTIEARNQPTGGMEFLVSLPMVPGRASTAPPEPPPARERRRVVVVEDEERLGRALESVLEEVHDVELFSTASEAYTRLLAPGPTVDLVLCDIRMAGMSGTELYVRVRAARPELGDRFVFMSGGVQTAEVRELIAKSGTPLLAKPFDMDQVWAVLTRKLAR